MPYIKLEDREKFESWELSPDGMGELCEHCGELNYVISRILIGYIKKQGFRYQTVNDILGVLSALALEWYRRLFGYYENAKIVENGDVISAEEMRFFS